MLFTLVGFKTVWDKPRSLARSKNSWFMVSEYWWVAIECFSQSMSGRLKSPLNQKIDFLNLCFTLKISSHKSLLLSKDKSGALYAEHKITGDLPGILIFTKIDSETLLFSIKTLLKIFFTQITTPPPLFPSLSLR